MRPFPRKISLVSAFMGAVLLAFQAPPAVLAQVRPTEITAAQAVEVPYRLSGRLLVYQGSHGYLGTATYIRRYTGLTAAHLLYSGKNGFSTAVRYEPALYGQALMDPTPVGFFSVLSGYQAVAAGEDATDAAFERDMGYLVLTKPAYKNEWASWSADPAQLEQTSSAQVLGYAAEKFRGDKLAQVLVDAHYGVILSPGLFESTRYYAEEGMSGGPVYTIGNDGRLAVSAVTVGGTSPPSPAYSDVRAITPEERKLFLEAEYAQGIIKKGFIEGQHNLSAGGSTVINTGVIFADGTRETADFSSHYDEVKLVAKGSLKKKVQISKQAPGSYRVTLPADFPVGEKVSLALLRTTVPKKNQTPLATFKLKAR